MDYTFFEQETGPLKVFKEPQDGMVYTMGIDGSTGLADDYSAIQIFSNMLPFEQCAVFHAKLPIIQISEYANNLGRWYNNALNICEVNYPGNSIQDALLQYYQYPRNYQPESHLQEELDIATRYGFHTTETTKWILIHEALLMLEANEFRIHDPETLEEMNNFVFQQSRRQAAAAPGFNDDLVMSMMLALHGCKLYPIVVPQEKKQESVVKTTNPDTKRDWATFRKQLMTPNKRKHGVVL